MTIHMLDTSPDEDPYLAAADFVGTLLNEGQAKTALADTPGSVFVKECTALLAAERHDQFLQKLLTHLDVVFSSGTAQDVECITNLLVHCAEKVPASNLPPVVQQFCSTLPAKVDDRAEERLGALLNLYGALQSHSTLQRQVLLAAVDFARKGPRLAAMLVPAVRGKSGEWVRLWKLDEAQRRELLIALATLVKIGSDRASVKEYQSLVTSALGLCAPGDAAAIAQLRGMATAALIDFARSPSVFQADYASSPAVQALGQDAATQPLYGLFTSMLSGDLSSFKAAATPAALEAANTALDPALAKARMLALLALCSQANREVTYQQVASALDIGVEAVEGWVVKAIGAKLLEARIDQVRGVIAVSHCTQRTFGPAEWLALRQQLSSWRDALKSVHGVITEHTGVAAAMAGVSVSGSTGGSAQPVRG